MLYIPVLHIDTNLINARGRVEELNQLERWADDEVILINFSSVAREEALAGSNPERTRKVNTLIFTATEPAAETDPVYRQVEAALFPRGAATKSQRNDVRIVCEAIHYHAILVTNDGASKSQPGGILGNRDKLSDLVTILAPAEATQFVASKIRERDETNRRIANEYGGTLPSWTGCD